MLVLGRKPSERFVIGPDVRITVISVEGNRVRLGIEAPAEMSVVREELPPKGLGPNRHRRDAKTPSSED